MKITAHQPEYLPWLGFFHKLNRADIFVVLDNVQYRRRYFQNRNKIRTHLGEQYITVPVFRENRDQLLIKDVRIFNDDNKWKRQNFNSVSNAYSRAEFFNNYFKTLEGIWLRDFELLIDLNLEFISYIMRILNIGAKIVLSSSLGARGTKSDLILDICKKLKADTYISGVSGRDYLNNDDFEKAGVRIEFQEFHHPIYNQLHEPFLPCMSVLDLLFNCGPKSLSVINGVDSPVMERIFL